MSFLAFQVIPLESVMKKPDKMPRVLDVAALVVVGINLPSLSMVIFSLGATLKVGLGWFGPCRVVGGVVTQSPPPPPPQGMCSLISLATGSTPSSGCVSPLNWASPSP